MHKFFHITTKDADKILKSLDVSNIKGIISDYENGILVSGVTVVFDLSGSSVSIKENGPDQFIQSTRYMFKEITEIIYELGGIIEKFPGDGISFHFFDALCLGQDSISINSAVRAVIETENILRRKYNLIHKDYRFSLAYGKEIIITKIGNSYHEELITIGHAVNVSHKLEKELKKEQCFLGMDFKCFSTSEKLLKACLRGHSVKEFSLPKELHTSNKPEENSWFGLKY